MRNILLIIVVSLASLFAHGASFVVTNINNSGSGSLRQAIIDANALGGADTVQFSISGGGVQTIVLSSALPNITGQLFIDGFSQAGSSSNTQSEGSNADLRIEVSGNNVVSHAFRFNASSCGTRGLVINRFTANSIIIEPGANACLITGCYFGLNAAGNSASGTGNGILVQSAYNTIGNWSDGDRNRFSGVSSGAAITFSGVSAFESSARNNHIGVALDGTTTMGGIQHGFLIEAGAAGNRLGEHGSAFNYISGCSAAAIAVTGNSTVNNNFLGNYIWNNSGLGIDLGNDGVTNNDPGDGDSGPHERLNFPTIHKAYTDGNGRVYTHLTFECNSYHSYRLDFYASPTADPSGNGEGAEWIGTEWISSGALTTVDEHVTAGRWIDHPGGTYITCTLYEQNGAGSSEFSVAVPAVLNSLVVNNSNDVVNGNTASVIELIDSPGGDGISLREAIMACNSTLNAWTPDWIYFDIPGSGVHTISLTTPLPDIMGDIGIDAYAEPGYNNSPTVHVDGSGLGAGVNCFNSTGAYNFFYALAITGFSGDGINATSDDGQIAACYIGVEPDGSTCNGNGGVGVRLNNVRDWYIGMDWANDPNVISGNSGGGVIIEGSGSTNNEVIFSYIGTNANGNSSCGSQPTGIVLRNGANGNRLGSYGPINELIVAGNTNDGIQITDDGTDYNKVIKTFVGIGPNGSSSLPNGRHGIALLDQSFLTRVGEPNFGNVISANTSDGIHIESDGNRMWDNIIGLAADGNTARGNGANGIGISQSSNTTIGGGNSNDGNVISANGGNGIEIWAPSCAPCSNDIKGNIIGLNASGTADRGNNNIGISLLDANGNIVGGLNSGEGNVVSGNGSDGINLSEDNADDNLIQGNFIGTNSAGTAAIGNDEDGVSLYGGAEDNVIGGASTGARNIISGNGGDGIQLSGQGSPTRNNDIYGNYIGLDVNGTSDLGNSFYGINTLNQATNNVIGGSTDATNVISGNGSSGINICSDCSGHLISGNIIGLNSAASAAIPNDDDGIYISGTNTTVGGSFGQRNIISGNGEYGIFVGWQTASNNTIQGNFIGTDGTGNAAIGNDRAGIRIDQSANNTIGGTGGRQNIIGGNGGDGISIGGGDASGNSIIGNHIGIGADGSSDVGNNNNGIELQGVTNTTIGGTAAEELNVVSFNGQVGIMLDGTGTGIEVSTNYVGTDATGNSGAGNAYSGIQLVSCSQAMIGTDVNDRILVADNGIDGIRISSGSSNTIQRCYIGTDLAGASAIGNSGYGIHIQGNSDFNIIGTDSDGSNDSSEGNVVSGNGAGFRLRSTGGGSTIVAGNLIGTDASGNSSLGNSSLGIELYDELYCRIGTDGNGVNDINERNIIAGNGSNAIRFSNASENLIAGNHFGVGLDGTTALSNGNVSVYLAGTCRDNWIGYKASTMTEDDPEIVGNKFHNENSGALSLTSNSIRNRISRNSFKDNDGIAIDLNNDAVTSNDNGDGDVGANDLLNFPVIDLVQLVGNTLTVAGFSRNGMDIEFYLADAGPSPDPLPYAESFGEGQTFLFSRREGSGDDLDNSTTTYTDDGTGPGATRNENRFEFDVDVSGMGLTASSRLTALTIESNNNTSEFSAVTSTSVAEICNNGIDDDGDGLVDCFDPDCNGSSACPDNDNDGITDAIDLDDDNDGLLDTEECSTLGPELIQNGDFENGYAYWTSDFNRGRNNFAGTAGGCPAMGWMAISPCATDNGGCPDYLDYNGSVPSGNTLITTPLGSDPNVLTTTNCNISSWSCLAQTLPDHTTGSGLSVYVDPNDIVGQAYIKQDVTVSANTTYNFSAWIMVIEEDPNIQFQIDGNALTTGINLDRLTGGTDGPDTWQEVNVLWYSGAVSGTVEIALVNLTAGCGGNDLRIDDVSLRQINVDDSDGDGIADCFDLDSDGDGCDDVLEAGFEDPDFDGELGSATLTVDSDGLVTSASSGYTGIQSPVTDADIQIGCPDFDNDNISNINDLDDDNDGIVDLTEFDCSGAFLQFNVTWSQSNGGNDAFIHNPGTISNGADLVVGSGLNSTFTSARTDINSFGSETFAEARMNNEYIEYEFTTQPMINAMLLRDMSHNKNPSSSPDHYGYHIGITISEDNFATETVIKNYHYIDNTIPAGWQHDYLLNDAVDYHFHPSTTYKFRVYFFKKDNDAVAARWDDFAFLTFNCSESGDVDNDGAFNHQDLDTDGDGCDDVLEAGFTDGDFDGYLGSGPVSVDSDGLVTSGSDGYSGTNSFVINASQQSGCADFDNDGISDVNDLDDDNDGILDTVECPPLPGIVQPQADAVSWLKNGYGVYAVGNNTNGQGYLESGFQKAVFSKGLSLVVLNGSSDFTFTGATGEGSATSSVGTFADGSMTFTSSYTTTNRAEFRTTTSGSFTSGGSGQGIYVKPEQGGNTGDAYSVFINFTSPVTAFSFDWKDIFDSVVDENPELRYAVYADGTLLAYLEDDMIGDDASGPLTLYNANQHAKGNLVSGQALETTLGFVFDEPVSNIELRYEIVGGSILSTARDPHGIDQFAYSTDTPCTNSKDLDSDDDGCPDVVEAGLTDNDSDGILGSSPVSVDGDGLVTSGTDGYTGTTPFVTNAAQQSGCADNDNDLVSDLNDKDDDNDGIMDVDEWNCSSALPEWDAATSNGNLSADFSTPSGVSGTVITTAPTSGSFNPGRPTYTTVATGIRANRGGGSGAHTVWKFDQPSVVQEFLVLGIKMDSGEEIQLFNAYGSGGQPIPYSVSATNGGFVSGDTLYGGPSTNSALQSDFTFTFEELVDSISIRSIGAVDFVFMQLSNACLGDNDNDGVADHLDLDSDNDGIYDVWEAGHGQAQTDGSIDGSVDIYGIPLLVSNGVGGVTYTISNSDGSGLPDAYALDSDADGCFDVAEAGYTDANNDGILGSSPTTVNPANGLVTSGGP